MSGSKTAVVTGVTSGIGEALTARLLREEYRVLGVGRDPRRLAELRERWGEGFVPVTIDLAVPAERARGVAEIRESAPQIDVLVNNAAEVVYATPIGLAIDRWRRLLEIDLLAAIELTQGLAAQVPSGGHVVMISSVTTRFVANPSFTPYALAKTALESFTDGLRLELGPRGVAVTTVRPGLVATPAYDKVEGFEKARARLAEAVPDWLRADDVAEAIGWIVSRPPTVVVSEISLLPRGQTR
jgi:NAD(P)-dependent dehydrogenase (short-subunit alcohol dehydrogenase family)